MKKDQEIIKQNNIKLFLDALLENRPAPRIELAKKTNMSPTSITRIASLLISKGFIVETDTFSKGIGRHAIMLDTVKNSAYSIGIDIKSHLLRFAIIDFHKDCVATKSEKYNIYNYSIEELANIIYEETLNFLSEHHIAYEKIIGIGVSIPGIIDNRTNIISFSTQLQWKNQDIAKFLQPLFKKPIVVENDAKARVIGEKHINKIPNNVDCAMLIIGNGVSSAALSQGKLVRGFDNAAGEIGHITLEPNGILCDCGNKGCIQTRLSDKFLIRTAKQSDNSIDCLEDILTAYYENKDWAKDIVSHFKYSFTLALNILEGCYNPVAIIASGHVVETMEPILKDCIKDFIQSKSNHINVMITKDVTNVAATGSAIIASDMFITNLIGDLNYI